MTTPGDLIPGACTAVVQYLAVTGADRVYSSTDDETLPIGEAPCSAAYQHLGGGRTDYGSRTLHAA